MSDSRSAIRPAGVQVIDRAVQIIQVVADHPRGIQLGDLARRVDLPKSTTRRILSALQQADFCEQDANGAYLVGVGLFEVGMRWHARGGIREKSEDAMRWLAETTEETAFLFVQRGLSAICINKVDGSENYALLLPLGARLPLHIGVAGQVMLSTDSAAVDAYLEAASPLEALGPRSITTSKGLKQSTGLCRKQGWLFQEDEITRGASSIGAPIRDFDGRTVAALAIAGFTARFEDRKEDLTRAVLVAAHKISENLGFPGQPHPLIASELSDVDLNDGNSLGSDANASV